MLGLNNDDPKVEEVFRLACMQKLERHGLRKPSHSPAVETGIDDPLCIQHLLSSADDPSQDSTLEMDDNETNRENHNTAP